MPLQLYIPAVSFVLYISTVATQKQPESSNNAMSATDSYASCCICTKARKSIEKLSYNAGNDKCTVPSTYHQRRIIYNRIFFFILARQPPVGQGLFIHEVSRSLTMTNHSRKDSSGRVISLSQRPLTDNTHNRQTSLLPVGFEPTISASEQPQSHALDRVTSGNGIIGSNN